MAETFHGRPCIQCGQTLRYKSTHCVNCRKHKSRKWKLRDRYGITVEQYDEMITAQCEKCAICGDDLKQAFIDHDHKTGRVRGILCRDCNLMLGSAKDNINTLRNAIHYLIT